MNEMSESRRPNDATGAEAVPEQPSADVAVAGLQVVLGARLVPQDAGHPTDLNVVKALAGEGKLRPVIDRTYPLGDAAGALRHIEAGHTRGKVVVTVSDAVASEDQRKTA